ncbi:MAG: YfhO family protein [Thermoanaerobaculia bacterium]
MLNATWLYVAAVYAAAVWLARRGGAADLRWRVAAFFYALVFIFLRPALTSDFVNLPVDFLTILPPWTDLTRYNLVWNSEINDLVLQIVPWAHQVRESWLSFEAPLWNHMAGSGYPLLANGQSAALSPLRILALPLPLGQSFAFEASMKILAALTFTFLYCRRRGYAELPSAIGAISFGFSSFIIVWLHFPMATVAAFVPAALYFIDLLVERVTLPRFVCAAALWTMLIFSGHPETVAHIFFISLLYLVWILAVERVFPGWRDAIRFVLILGGALTVAALLAAPFLVPFAEALTRSKRYHELKVTPNVIGYYSDWPSFVVLLQPHFYGEVPFEKSWGPATAESITGFAGALGIGAWLTLLIHSIRTRRWRSREGFFVVATVVVLGIILGWPVISELFHVVFKLAANARLRLMWAFLLAVQTAAVVDLVRQNHARRFWLIGVGFSAAVLLYLMQSPFDLPYRRDAAFLAIAPSLLVLLVATAVPLVPTRRRDLVLALLTVAIIGELWSVSRNWNPMLRDSLMYPSTPLIDKLQEFKTKQPPDAPFRIVGAGPAFFANTPAIYGFEDVRTHDPMANGRYLGILRVLTGYSTEDYFAKWQNMETGVLDFLNVKYIATQRAGDLGDPQRFNLVYDGSDGRIFENQTVLPRFYPVRNVVLEFKDELFNKLMMSHSDWGNTALLDTLAVENDQMRTDMLAPRAANAPATALVLTAVTPTDYRMKAVAPRYTMIVSSIPWWPGWKVEANGKRIEPVRVNGGFLGFPVRPGTSHVRVWYSPRSWWAGVGVAAMTALILMALSVRRRISRFEVRSSN